MLLYLHEEFGPNILAIIQARTYKFKPAQVVCLWSVMQEGSVIAHSHLAGPRVGGQQLCRSNNLQGLRDSKACGL